MKRKSVYVNDVPIGSASTWHEVVALLTKIFRRTVTVRDAQDFGSEGPDGFYIKMER